MGVDKATLEVNGVAMAERVCTAMEQAGATEVVTVGGPSRDLRWRHVVDRYPGEGPLGGIITALSSLPAGLVLVAACDLAWVTASVFRALLAGLGDADVAIAHSGRPEPLCALWVSPRCLEPLEHSFAAGERAVHRGLGALVIESIAVEPRWLRNVNTPADLGDDGEPN